MVWSNQQSRDIEFDRANDLVDGGAISCATNTSASQFQAAIDALRAAARSGDKARMLEQLGLPLLYIDRDGEQVELDDDQIDALYDEVFDARLIGAIERLDLSQMTVVPPSARHRQSPGAGRGGRRGAAQGAGPPGRTRPRFVNRSARPHACNRHQSAVQARSDTNVTILASAIRAGAPYSSWRDMYEGPDPGHYRRSSLAGRLQHNHDR